MNRNTENHFGNVPQLSMQRSTFDLSQSIKTTFNAGQLIPFYIDLDVLPGDTFKTGLGLVCRTLTPIYPVMDNCYIDTYFFYIPTRILWNHFKEFMGENRTTAWVQPTEYEIPMFTTPAGGASKGTIMDYMGIPILKAGLEFSQLGLRAYIKTYNEWFRDQNLIAPVTEYEDDTSRTASNTTSALGGAPLKVAKYHDYFTSCLPAPQKGDSIEIPVGSATAPVFGNGKAITFTDGTNKFGITGDADQSTTAWAAALSALGANVGDTASRTSTSENKFYGIVSKADTGTHPEYSGLYTDLSSAYATTINVIRQAFAAQKILERDARGGTRYTEINKSHFGVTSPDARMQRPEYLGGKRIPVTISQVEQTSSTDTTSPQGNVSGYSLTANADMMFTKSFTEHGIIIGLCCVRQDHSYQQGLNKMWSRKRRLDFYMPEMAHLGEQAVLNKEIFAQATSTDNEVFGYQERWAEYKYKPNIITGAMRSTYAQPLDAWHYGDKYTSLPVLSQEWIEETDVYIGRTLAVTGKDQFQLDAYVKTLATRVMPIYSTPGLLDHF